MASLGKHTVIDLKAFQLGTVGFTERYLEIRSDINTYELRILAGAGAVIQFRHRL
jgi:hypothetical protein